MSKKKRTPLSRDDLLCRMPGFPRPRLTKSQLVDIGMCHIASLELISKGTANEKTLGAYLSNVLTWLKAAELVGAGVDEMHEQFEVATRLLERYRLTGRVLFTGPDLQAAKLGQGVMDDLAELVDKAQARKAAEWSETVLPKMMEPVRAYRAAQELGGAAA